MADLYGVGCPRCNKEVAAAYERMPQMDGYLDTDAYNARYKHLPAGTWPLPYLDGKPMPHTISIVQGEDGWLMCCALNEKGLPYVCPCVTENIRVEVWRGHVEIR